MMRYRSLFKLFSILLCISVTTSLWAQQPIQLGKLRSAVLTELSGIVQSSYNANLFWVHNDSGDKSAIYGIDEKAQLKATVALEGIALIDAEDIAKLRINNEPYLLLADIGNNQRNRDTLSLYLFKEPVLTADRAKYYLPKEEIKEIRIRYKDKKRDAEAIFVDPVDNAIYIVSKRDFKSTVFRLEWGALKDNKVYELEPKMELPFNFVTAADIRPDGRFILIKNLTNVFLWERKEDTDLLETLKGKYKRMPYLIEPQGEALCFDFTDRFFYTISERPLGLDTYLYRYDY